MDSIVKLLESKDSAAGAKYYSILVVVIDSLNIRTLSLWGSYRCDITSLVPYWATPLIGPPENPSPNFRPQFNLRYLYQFSFNFLSGFGKHYFSRQ